MYQNYVIHLWSCLFPVSWTQKNKIITEYLRLHKSCVTSRSIIPICIVPCQWKTKICISYLFLIYSESKRIRTNRIGRDAWKLCDVNLYSKQLWSTFFFHCHSYDSPAFYQTSFFTSEFAIKPLSVVLLLRSLTLLLCFLMC